MKEILNRCKCGVFLTINEHRVYYETASQWLEDRYEDTSDTPKEVIDEMIKRDTIMNLHFYPDTPISFYSIWHYDYDELIKQAIEIIKELT